MNEELAGRRIALLGGAGFIGHHVALALAAQGAHVEAIDSLQVNNLMSFTSAASAHSGRPYRVENELRPTDVR